MNYRHIFHAGNICDVVKHTVLTLLIEHLRQKDKPFCIIDTHAGIGLYDLQDPRAQKTAEAQNGVLKLVATLPLPELTAYYGVLQSSNEGIPPESLRFYPGSPFLVARLLRPEDRLIACELHEEDVETLRQQARIFPNIQIHRRDAAEALGAFLPPAEKRGLVLIDPPYEVPDEFDRLVPTLAAAYALWPQGIFMLWYPVKERPVIWRFHEALRASGITRQLCAEFIYEEETRHDRLNGCGIILVNPPWQFDEKLHRLFPALHEALQTAHHGATIDWLAGEKNAGD